MNQRFLRMVRLTFAATDLLSVNLVYLLNQHWYKEHIPVQFEQYYNYLWFFVNISWLASCYASSVYQGRYVATFETFCRKTLQSYFYFLGLVVLYLFFSKQVDISRLFVISILVSISVVILINRFIYLMAFHFFSRKDYLLRKVIILGYNDTAKKLANYLEGESMNTHIVGFCENEKNINELTNYPVIGDYADIIEASKHYNITEIYSTIAPEQDYGIYKLMADADQACIRFKVVPDLNFFVRRPVHIDYFGQIPVLSMRREPLDDIGNQIKKRICDVLISGMVILFILSWMIPIIGLLIWIESRGPIFFVQKRSGKDNKPFGCMKFRSMYMNNDANQKQASKNDDRITKIGRILRKTSLDEFPQFLNVFIGNMSLTGPRPHMLKHTDDYSKLLNQYMVRQFLKPGITGWAQINGFRGETRSLDDMKARVEHDLWYMENWSLWLDTKIIFITVYNMIRGDKNAF